MYYLAPEPRFNILRPIAGGFHALLAAIGADLAKFLHVCWATVSVQARPGDGFSYGLEVLQYVPDRRGHAKPSA